MFGGLLIVGPENSNDTWVLQSGHWTNITATAQFPTPGLCLYPLMSDDPANSGALLVGISHGASINYIEATYVFRAGVWTNLTSTVVGAPPVVPPYASLNWFGQGSAVVLSTELAFDPNLGTEEIDRASWEFAHDSWTDLNRQLVPPCSALAGGSSVGDGTILLYAGDYVLSTETYQDWTYVFSLPPSAAPLAASPLVSDLGMAVGFAGTPEEGIGPLTGNFTFGDGTFHTGSSASASHTYGSTGTFVVNYTVTDWLGRSSTASVTVVVNPVVAVTAVSASATSVDTAAKVLFAATATGGTAPLTYAWDFGDGTTSSEVAPEHQWSSSGTYTVSVTVTDSLGSHDSKNLTVTVSNPSSGFSWTSGSGPIGLLALVAVVVAIVSVLGTFLVTRRRKGAGAATGSPASWTPPPPPSGAPPQGAAPPPPSRPDWSESPPPGGPPPGAT